MTGPDEAVPERPRAAARYSPPRQAGGSAPASAGPRAFLLRVLALSFAAGIGAGFLVTLAYLLMR